VHRYDVADYLIPLDGLLNLRELGGFPTASGRVTQRKRLLRSDYWEPIPLSTRAALIAYGVRTVIDLRDAPETVDAGDVFAGAPGIDFHALPFFDDDGLRLGPLDMAMTKGWRYLRVLELYPDNIRAIFQTLAGGEGVTLFHCVAGKDRTGLTAAILLMLAGVPDELIAQDYAVSEPLLMPRTDVMRAEAVAQGDDMTVFARRAACAPETMQEVLDGLRARYGGAEGYLRRVGLSAGDLERLRARLIDGPGGPS
jgi:protein-tyrosine phosphatase